MWGIIETIAKGAFNRALTGEEKTLALFNHNDSYVLGNTESRTLTLEDSNSGLVCRCELPNTTYANDLFEIVSRGDVKTMSFMFIPEKWEYSSEGKERTLKDVHLEEVSFGVSFPAYPETKSSVSTRGIRKLLKRTIDIDSINELLDKDTLTDEDKTQVNELICGLQEIVGIKRSEPGKTMPDEEAEELALLAIATELEIGETE
jgi:HK97 family phage prohead protease